MAALQKTYSGHPDHLGNIARMLWMARNVAKSARQESQAWALRNPDLVKGVEPAFGKGQIFSRELQRRATSRLPKRFQRQLHGPSDYWARGQGIVDPLMGLGKDTKMGGAMRLLPEYQNIAHPDEKAYRANSSKVPQIPTTTNNNNTKGTAVKDQQLGNFLAAVALSLSSSFNSINKKLDESTEGITSAKDGIDNTYKKLEQHSDSLENKLDDIIEALRFSNRQDKEKKDDRQAQTKIAQQKEKVDLSNTNRILMQDMDRQEIRDLQRENIQDQVRDDQAGSQIPPDPWMDDTDDLPQLSEGGIVSGPDSGYLAVLHGDEAVIPLDNNYTQGQPSAVGKEPVSQMPMMAERCIVGDNRSTMKPSFTPNVNLTSPTPQIGSKASNSSSIGENLAKAIELPVKAAGLVTMGVMNKVLRQGNLSPKVIKNLKSISAPIAAAFGVPDVMTADLLSDSTGEGREDFSSSGGGKRRRERGLFGRFRDWITGTGGSYGGRGYGGRGYGGSTVYNRVSGTGGGTAIAWGKKEKKQITSKSDFGSILRRTANTDAMMVINGMGDPARFEKKYGITAEDWMKLPDYLDQSSLNSPVFTKNVSYENAFDYKAFESPNYGLKTSEIAYNMSLQDEVNNMIEGLSDPDSQVILNNNASKANAGKQIEHSAIAIRGNPLKEGTYLSPYSV